MYFKYPINDCHIHLFSPKDIKKCQEMIDFCGYTNWAFQGCTLVPYPNAICQNLIGALLKLKENGRCQAFASFHYDESQVPSQEELLRQIEFFDHAGFDGIKMLDGKPGVRKRHNIPLDAANYDLMFQYAAKKQFPILYHINDPIEFWYYDRLPEWAKDCGNFYGDGTFPHKYEIDQETFGFLRKHPNLKICIAHFFFISDQPGLCDEMLNHYPNLYFDITPGWEMFENFASDLTIWKNFFSKYSHKILFGTDTFSDHWQETVSCLKKAMETSESFVAFEENCIGMNLPEKVLRDIYFNNYYKFIGRSGKPMDVNAILSYADTLYDKVENGPHMKEVKAEITYLKEEITKYLS